MTSKTKRERGAKRFNQEDADKVLQLVSEGSNLTKIGKDKDNGLPHSSTLFEWRKSNDDFASDYVRAMEARAEWRTTKIDDMIDGVIDESIEPHAARVVIDAHKWQAGRECSKYNDKLVIQQEISVTHTMPALERFTAKIEAMAERRQLVDVTPDRED